MPVATVKYYGWSGLSVETSQGVLLFDPFYRAYCGAQWFGLEDFARATVVCVTHGHEEHYLDVPAVARRSGARVVGDPLVCSYLRWRNGLPPSQLQPLRTGGTVALPGFKISSFTWKHRDINLWKALTRAVFQGNATQLSWAWSSATNAPFYSPYTGFVVELPDGTTIMNYNEGFNSKMTDAEIDVLARRFKVDVLLGGMQLNFVADVARGAAALKPRKVVLYPPHEHFHKMMGASAAPWSEFGDAVRHALPQAEVVLAAPGTAVAV